jgi:hypothetical protein
MAWTDVAVLVATLAFQVVMFWLLLRWTERQ